MTCRAPKNIDIHIDTDNKIVKLRMWFQLGPHKVGKQTRYRLPPTLARSERDK